MIYLTAGRQEITPQGGKTAVLEYKAGEVKWSPASGMHVSEVTSNAPVRIVEVEVKKAGDPGKAVKTPLDPVTVDPKDYTLEFENSQVRVLRVKFPPHHAVPLHEHLLNLPRGGVHYRTSERSDDYAGRQKWIPPSTKLERRSRGAPVKHQEENMSDKAFEAVVVELKS